MSADSLPASCDMCGVATSVKLYFLAMTHYVYILASYRGAIYTGSTRNLARRLEQHASGAVVGFARKYRTNRLVFVEAAESAESAFARERQIKSWRREKKAALIASMNPLWEDLSIKVEV